MGRESAGWARGGEAARSNPWPESMAREWRPRTPGIRKWLRNHRRMMNNQWSAGLEQCRAIGNGQPEHGWCHRRFYAQINLVEQEHRRYSLDNYGIAVFSDGTQHRLTEVEVAWNTYLANQERTAGELWSNSEAMKDYNDVALAVAAATGAAAEAPGTASGSTMPQEPAAAARPQLLQLRDARRSRSRSRSRHMSRSRPHRSSAESSVPRLIGGVWIAVELGQSWGCLTGRPQPETHEELSSWGADVIASFQTGHEGSVSACIVREAVSAGRLQDHVFSQSSPCAEHFTPGTIAGCSATS